MKNAIIVVLAALLIAAVGGFAIGLAVGANVVATPAHIPVCGNAVWL